jgi:N-acetyl-gamma-glutamylphosphate reductase
VSSSYPQLKDALRQHPYLTLQDGEPENGAALTFMRQNRKRSIAVGAGKGEIFGLPELMDNNPLVCTDSGAVPSPESTLAIIALGPLIRSSVLAEPPAIIFAHMPSDETADEIDATLAASGWFEGATYATDPQDLGTAMACTIMAMVTIGEDSLHEIDSIYEEAYSRAFFVQESPAGEWDTKLVVNKPLALYKLRVTPHDTQSLLTIQVLADKNGKCGASQIIHMMNIMAGFEETLGLEYEPARA